MLEESGLELLTVSHSFFKNPALPRKMAYMDILSLFLRTTQAGGLSWDILTGHGYPASFMTDYGIEPRSLCSFPTWTTRWSPTVAQNIIKLAFKLPQHYFECYCCRLTGGSFPFLMCLPNPSFFIGRESLETCANSRIFLLRNLSCLTCT